MTYTISTENKQLELDIQQKINKCLDNFESFCFDAGAGAGKPMHYKSQLNIF